LLERITMRMRISHIDFDRKSKQYVKDNIEPKFTPDEISIFKKIARKLMGDNACIYTGCNLFYDCVRCDGYKDRCTAYVPEWFCGDDR
jgi:hypothetical protein